MDAARSFELGLRLLSTLATAAIRKRIIHAQRPMHLTMLSIHDEAPAESALDRSPGFSMPLHSTITWALSGPEQMLADIKGSDCYPFR